MDKALMRIIYILAFVGMIASAILPSIDVPELTEFYFDPIPDSNHFTRAGNVQIYPDYFVHNVWGYGNKIIPEGDSCRYMAVYHKDNNEHIRFITEDSLFEWIIKLNEMPESDTLKYPIEIYGLKYKKQEPLEAWMVASGDKRPDYITGGYVFYRTAISTYKRCVHNWTHDSWYEEYGIGKAFEIHRILLWDADYDLIGGEINITDDTMYIILPQGYKEYARFPIYIDPTWGYTSEGSSTLQAGFSRANVSCDWKIDPSTTDAPDSVKAYVKEEIGQAGTADINIYSMSDSDTPGSRQAALSANIVIANTAFTWQKTIFTFPPNLSNGTEYALAVALNDYGILAYDDMDSSSVNEDASFPATWVEVGHQIRTYSMYCYMSNATNTLDCGGDISYKRLIVEKKTN